MSTIIFEERMRELIKLMPVFVDGNGDFPVNYEHGTQDVLNKFLVLKRSKTIYPLIWLISGKNVVDTVRNSVSNKSRFVIAKESKQVDKFNDFQYTNDFQKVLVPVMDNFITLLNISGITTINNNTLTYEFKANYSVKEEKKGLITVWNAIVLDVEVIMYGDRCINKNLKF